MPRPAPRLNRLPQRLDYTLIPAPLDLTLPLVDEKATLPAIIVTPSSPSGETDFSIAFIAPPAKPTFVERLSSMLPSVTALRHSLPSQIQLPASPLKTTFQDHSKAWSVKTRARSTLLLALLFFIMGCHVIMHRLATGRPHLEFGSIPDEDIIMMGTSGNAVTGLSSVPSSAMASSKSHRIGSGWISLHSPWDSTADTDGKRAPEFVVWEDPATA